MARILGISAYYHDSAACLTDGGRIIAAAQEERFTRRRHDSAFPARAAAWCLAEAGLGVADLDAVIFYDKPLLKFERLLETYYAFAPRGLRSFVTALPVWVKEKVFLKTLLRRDLKKLGGAPRRLLFSDHHLSHAASAFFPSPFEEAAILTVDGVGEWATASIARGRGGKIETLREMHFPHSAGLLYSAFTAYLGFKVNSGEYKVMGLAPYGRDGSGEAERYAGLIKEKLVRINDDGSVRLDLDMFDFPVGQRMACDEKWARLFGFQPRRPEAQVEACHCRFALAAQLVTEEIMLKMAATARALAGTENLCLAGGVALNCVANSALQRSGLFKNIWAQPAAGDAGGALGAALAAEHMYFSGARKAQAPDAMRGALLGPQYTRAEIKAAADALGAVYKEYPDSPALCAEAAQRLAAGQTCGWFQGRLEWGPRALGNRSILADARNPDMQRRLNLQVKRRESFRPFAPAVTWGAARDYFDCAAPSPYMLFTAPVSAAAARRRALPAGYESLPLEKRLYFERSELPAVTHLDYSARLQTVHAEINPLFHELLEAFGARTGNPVLLNTSFNRRGEPIVCMPEDAYRCFMATDLDFLVMGNFVFEKSRQPVFKEAAELFEPD